MLRHLIATFSLIGVALSAALLLAHAGSDADGTGAGVLPLSICGESNGCHEVLNSRWAWFPPLPADVAAGESQSLASASGSAAKQNTNGARLPVALLGLFYFTVVTLWMWICVPGVPRFGGALVTMCVAGAISSVAFVVIMIQSIGAICPLCFCSHVANFCILGLVVRGHLSLRKAGTEVDSKAAPLEGIGKFAAVAMTVLAFQALLWNNIDLRKTNLATASALHELQSDIDATEMIYLGQERKNVSVRDDSTVGLDAIEFDALLPASGTGYRNTIVVFGDVQCGACRKFHEFLMHQVRPAYHGHVRVVYKHLPLDRIHPQARKASLALEAARRQGKFWELLEVLYGQQGKLASFDYAAAVDELEMDLPLFVRDMSSSSAANRIAQDEALANSLGVEGTPAVFLNSRRVDKSILRLPGFWHRQVESLRLTRSKAGQAWGGADAIASANGEVEEPGR